MGSIVPFLLRALDSDARAGINGVLSGGGALTSDQKRAINTAVRGMKSGGLWDKLHAWFPIVGGTAGAHVVDFKRGTSAVNVNSPTHDASGAKSNGTTSYMSTSITPNTLGITGSLGAFLKEPRTAGTKVLVGSNTGTQIFRIYVSTSFFNYFGSSTFTQDVDTSAAHWSVVRESSTSLKTQKNGVLGGTSATLTTVGSNALPFFLLCDNVAGTPTNFCDLYCTQFWMGTTLVQSDITALHAILATLETAFGR